MEELPDSATPFVDVDFQNNNADVAEKWVRISELYPQGKALPSIIPDKFQRDQFEQGDHFECFMLTALSVLVNHPESIRNCFVSKKPRQDGRYTFQFFRFDRWHKVEIDDRIPLAEDDTLYIRSPTKHWWPLLIEKAYAKFYTSYSHIEGCTLHEALHDITGNPVLSVPLDTKLAQAAGAQINESAYWLDLSKKVKSGQMGVTALTKKEAPTEFGLREEQTYSIMEIVPLNESGELVNLLVHIYCPFEEDVYTGPMKDDDPLWTSELKAKYDPSRKNAIFIPLLEFLRVFNSMQLVYLKLVDHKDQWSFTGEWVAGKSAGGNPIYTSWRLNPMYLVRNTSAEPLSIIAEIRQEDQREKADPETQQIKYIQCGLVLTQASFPHPLPTVLVTGNNHKSVHKSLFLNSREVANVIQVPPNSLCYLVPTGMQKQAGRFSLGVFKLKGVNYGNLSVEDVSLSHMAWDAPATDELVLQPKSKDRVDFYVDEATEVHILATQKKKFPMKNGGDNMTEDFCGMYLYDDTDKKVGGVNAATNFREIGLVQMLPRSGRYALSVTCPKGSGEIPITVSVVCSSGAHVRIVDPPADAKDLDEEVSDDDEADAHVEAVDYEPRVHQRIPYQEPADSNTPYEDRQFYLDNKDVTNLPWLHIGELYPEGKGQPLVPDTLSIDQFEQGDHFECFMLTAFSVLMRHPDVIRNCFLNKNSRRDGRYAFQFFRYGQWVVVEVDDRIPVIENNETLFIRSPTKHWWPLLLEKAYAKFYNRYANVEGCTLQEALHDLSSFPVINIPLEDKLATAAGYTMQDPKMWVELGQRSQSSITVTALTRKDHAEPFGLRDEQTYGVLGVVAMSSSSPSALQQLMVKIYCPFVEDVYTGPMNQNDARWSSEDESISKQCDPKQKGIIYMPVEDFINVFASLQICHIKDVITPCSSFLSKWDDQTAGGNPIFVSWKDNPKYVVRNTHDEPVQVMFTIRQPDQRATLHTKKEDEPLKYAQCGMVLSQSNYKDPRPTHLVTSNNHRSIHKGLYLNSREVSNMVTVPANSLCYLIPSTFQKQVTGRFMLSYNLMSAADAKHVVISRYRAAVQLDKPATDELELPPKSKDRVDFLMDCPSDVHILLHQSKPFAMKSGGDTMTEDYCGMYLYNDKNIRITGVSAATNYRDTSLIYAAPKAGRYALSITCPKGSGKIPIKVSVVAVAAANVRITDPPEGAEEFMDVDLSFLDPEPEGVPIEELPLYEDAIFKKMLERYNSLHKNAHGNHKALEALEKEMNDRAHQLARLYIAKDRKKFLQIPAGYDLATFDPVLDEDQTFTDREVVRFDLKKDPRNASKVKDVEGELNARAIELAKELEKPDRTFVEEEIRGIPRADLNVEGDARLKELDKRLRNAKLKKLSETEIAEIQEEIRRVIYEVADAYIDKSRKFLDLEPAGLPQGVLNLDEDKTFKQLEKERMKLLKDPKANPAALKDLEKKMNSRINEMAKDLITQGRNNVLDQEFCGHAAGSLPLDNDQDFAALERKRIVLLANNDDGQRNNKEVADVEEKMKQRCDALALICNEKERPCYLDKAPEGVPLSHLPLNTDPIFQAGETRRARLKREMGAKAPEVLEAEKELNDRARELAKAMLSNDRVYLDPSPEGVALKYLPINENSKFKALESERLKLKGDAAKNDSKIKDKERELNECVRDMARALKQRHRKEALKKVYESIPVEDLALDEDEDMNGLEEERRRLEFEKQPTGDIDVAMDARALQMTQDLHAAERALLDRNPEGISIEDIPLSTDNAFVEAENQLRRLKRDPSGKQAAKIKEKEAEVKKLLIEAARRVIIHQRRFLHQEPHGISIKTLPLDKDEKFLNMETQLRARRRALAGVADVDAALLQDEDAVELMDEMNAYVDALALRQLKSDRNYLAKDPEGVPLEDVEFDDDSTFRKLEVDRTKSRQDATKKKQTAEIESALNDRVRELARQMLSEERKQYEQEPAGIPQHLLPIHTDRIFREIENKRRASRRNSSGDDDDFVDQANERLRALAMEALRADRSKIVQKEAEGVPVGHLPLDTDEDFHLLEVERFRLTKSVPRDNARISSLEKAMNDRAVELARAYIESDRAFLDDEYLGVLLTELPIANDKAFNDLQKDRFKAKKENTNPNKIVELEKKMNDRCRALAKETLERERPTYLEPEPCGILLQEIALDAIPGFTELELQRWKAKRHGLSDSVAEHENDLNELLKRHAQQMVDSDRAFLSPQPEGVPLQFIPFHEDKQFRDLEKLRRTARQEKKPNPDKVADLEAKMNNRNCELARKYLEKDRAYLDPEPEGIVLKEIPFNSDKTFRRLEADRQSLKLDADVDQHAIEKLEDALNERVKEIAMDMYEKDRLYLHPEPEGVPLSALALNTDRPFRDLEIARRKNRADPKRNGDRVKELEDQLNSRCVVLAKEWLANDRAYLDKEPFGVLLEYLPLNTDRSFRDMEKERSDLRKDPRHNTDAIHAIEERLNQRAQELAKELVAKERAVFLRTEFAGVPVDYLNIDDDADFREMERRRRTAKATKSSDPNVVKVLESDLNDRATELAHAFLVEEREFLNPNPCGISINDLPLDTDKPFHDTEMERRRLRRDPQRFGNKIRDLEDKLNERAMELARQMILADREYLNPEPNGVALEYLPLDDDVEFTAMEAERRAVKKQANGNFSIKVKDLEDRLNDRAHAIAQEYLDHERDYLDPNPLGIPLADVEFANDKTFCALEVERRRLRLDPRNEKRVQEMEDRLNERVRQLAGEVLGFQDDDFFTRNYPVASRWIRVSELYPEGQRDSLLPERPSGADVESGPEGSGFLAPFLAAMTRNMSLYRKIVETKVPKRRDAFAFQFHSHLTGPTRVLIDDRIPLSDDGLPAFTRAPNRHWYPMLIEKAYAKFRGGYKALDFVTPHEALRDLTGKPVIHIPLEEKLLKGSAVDPRKVKFWRALRDDIARGDIVTAMSIWEAPDGIHRQSSYAVMTVVDTVEGSEDPNDTLIRLHNSYHDAPFYTGPMHREDARWTNELLTLCKFDRSRSDTLFLPIPVFLRNFVSLQKCNCMGGEPVTFPGEWDARTSGGNPNSTSFRNNPIYVLENRGSRPYSVILELRHNAPIKLETDRTSPNDGQYADEDGPTYPQTGIIVLIPTTPLTIHTALLCHNAFRPLFKSVVLDSRELACSVEVPSTTTCFVIPYTMRRGILGEFQMSVYPFKGFFHFNPLSVPVVMAKPLTIETTAVVEMDSQGKRLDFLLDEASELHLLAQQVLPHDSGKKGNLHASNELQMCLFDEGDKKIAYSGDPCDYRELVVLTKTVNPGRYAILLLSPAGHPQEFPVNVSVFASKKANLRWCPLPPNARPLIQSRFPALPKSAPVKVPEPQATDRDDYDGIDVHRLSLPPIHRGDPLEMYSEKIKPEKVFKEVVPGAAKPKPPPKKIHAFGTSSPRLPW